QSLVSSTPGNKDMGYAINVFPYLAKYDTEIPIINPQAGSSFAGMATGEFYSGLVSGNFLDGGSLPKIYSDAHGGKLQSSPDCSSGTYADINDTVHLKLTLKAPANAKGFKFDFRFFSHEYWYYVCTEYNDFFLAILESNATGIPQDGNIAFDKEGNPVSVNNAFFTTCVAPSCSSSNFLNATATGCPASMQCISGKCGTVYGTCPDGNADLYAFDSDGGKYETSGGATAWLTTTAPILPGEEFILNFYIWDTGDNGYDSAAIIDNFRWITSGGSVSVGTDFSDGRI
ncbi:MAG: choice-of-anchor L domain-containing protein, partial [Proteobacteria bacterium]|nr:choice-of-anchor L domain-containing protein [Pseudomonadota bacterium]